MPDTLTITGDQCADCCACTVVDVEITITWTASNPTEISFLYGAYHTIEGYFFAWSDSFEYFPSSPANFVDSDFTTSLIGAAAGTGNFLTHEIDFFGTGTGSVTSVLTANLSDGSTVTDTLTVALNAAFATQSVELICEWV